MLRGFFAGAVTGGLLVWLFRDEIQAYMDEQARRARARAADQIHGFGETAERAFDRAAVPLRRAEEMLDHGKAQVSDTLRAAEQTLRPPH
jgi:hypothetical protein